MKVLSVLIIILFLNIDTATYTYAATKFDNINVVKAPSLKLRIEKVLSDKSGTTSEEIKNKLTKLKEKLERYEALTQEEVEFIRGCELDIIKGKLGDAQFEEYCKLIEKREGDGEFTPPERYRLYELEKQLDDIR